MVEVDLIQRDTAGMITCAYPFSAVPTNHVVTLDNGAIANGSGPLSSLCCPLVNTFESEASAAAFLEMHPELQGPILTIRDAVACGEAAFSGVLS
jgi:hypothetical protein